MRSQQYPRLRVCLLIAMFLVTFVAHASGSSSDGEVRAKMNYDLGKKLFQELIVCDTCPYADLMLDNESVRMAWSDLKRDLNRNGSIGRDLRIGHRHAIRYFIQVRFEI